MLTKPKGKQAVQQALIEAATSLLAQRGIAGVSVRDIAQAANVNHGLVHRHFGSKKGLVSAVITHLAGDVAKGMGGSMPEQNLHDTLVRAFVTTSSHRNYWRILGHIMLTEESSDMLPRQFPVVANLLRTAEQDSTRTLSPKALVSLMLSLGLGMMVFRPYLQLAIGIDDEEWQQIRQEIAQWAIRLTQQS